MISTVILTKNEEKNIIDCIESVLWCNEVIVIDDFSKDRTVDVLKSLNNRKIKVFEKELNEDFSFQRNFGMSKAKNEWVLFIDADERVGGTLKNEIIEKTKDNSRTDGFFIKRMDYLWSKKLKFGETGNIKFLRLGKKSKGKWIGNVHETWDIKGDLENLSNPMLHYPHKTMSEFLSEINYYTDIRSRDLYSKKEKVEFKDILIFPVGKFLLNYFFKLGILDGIQGLMLAITMSFHSFLVRGKLWQLWKKE